MKIKGLFLYLDELPAGSLRRFGTAWKKLCTDWPDKDWLSVVESPCKAWRGQAHRGTRGRKNCHRGGQGNTSRCITEKQIQSQPTPIPTWRETSGDNRRQDHFRGQEGYHTPTWRDNRKQRETRPLQRSRRLPHQPTPIPTWRETTGHFRGQEGYHTNQHAGRQLETRRLQKPSRLPHQPTRRETTGDKTTSEAKKATTPTNTHPHMKGDNRKQRETRPLQRPRRLPHQPTRRETTGDKTTSEAKKATTPTNTQGDNYEGRQPENNGRQDHFRGQEGYHTNQHAGRQLETRRLQRPRRLPHQPTRRETTGDKTTSEAKKATTPTNTHPHMKGDNRRQRETRPLQRPRRLPHQPTRRETTGDKTTSEAKKATTTTNTQGDNWRQDDFTTKKATTPTNTQGDNWRQDHFRGQESYHANQHPSPHEGRQPETTGDKTTSEAKKATTPTGTEATRVKLHWEPQQ